MNRVVVVGAGAREHALAWGLAKSAHVVVTPGNDGMRASGLWCTSATPVDLEADLFVIGPEVPLVAGLADTLRRQGKVVFGPNADGARLEGSKAYMKQLLEAANVPTAAYGSFDNLDAAMSRLHTMSPPYVIKTDGLAAGKGVLVTESLMDAERDVREKLSGSTFGDAGSTIVIEEALLGEECSLMVICDGEHAVALPPAQDFKRLGDGGAGPNTGGMGAFAPLATMSDPLVEHVMTNTIEPTLRELRRRGVDYRGVLYAGLMLTPSGPKLLEYNVRFGDPETQALIPLILDDLDEFLISAASGRMRARPQLHHGGAVTVVLAAAGYPQRPRSGDVIHGLASDGQLADPIPGVTVFHAGTRIDDAGAFVTAGGRVLAITATGESVDDARARAYGAAATVSFDGCQMRSDIASSHR